MGRPVGPLLLHGCSANVLITRNTPVYDAVGFRGRPAFCPVQFKNGAPGQSLQPPPSAQQSRDNSVRSLQHGDQHFSG